MSGNERFAVCFARTSAMQGSRSTETSAQESGAADRLDSWKEIAAYLRRDESTVRRWEKAGLPVRRHHHKVRATVFAYKSELDGWWNNGNAVAEKTLSAEPPRRGVLWLAVTGVVVLVVAIVAFRVATRSPVAATGPPLRITPFTSYSGGFRTPAFSPDGDRVAFAWTGTGTDAPGSWDIYVKMVGSSGTPLRITSDPGVDGPPAWSPDGRQIAFLRSQDRKVALYVTSALGGPERKVTDLAMGRYFNLQWTRDGIVFAEKTSPHEPYDSLHSFAIFLLSLETLQKRQLTFPTGPESDHRFAVSPDGATLAFLRHGFQSGVGVFTVPVGGREPKLLHTERAWLGHVAWGADGGSLIFNSMREGGNKLWRIAAAGGEPQLVPIAEESAYSPAVAPKGDRLAYVREYFDTDLMRLELSNGDGPARPERADASRRARPERADASRRARPERADVSRRAATPIAASARLETAPAFSPDGKKLAFFSEQSGRREMWISNADGGSPVQMTDVHAWDVTAPAWSPDGKQLLFYSGRALVDNLPGLHVIDVDTRQLRRLSTDPGYGMPHWSRDGRWIFAATGLLDDSQVVKLAAAGGAAIPITGKGTLMPRESPDGQHLYYLKTTGGIWRIPAGGGEESVVLPDFPWSMFNNWFVVNEGIYYVKPRSHVDNALQFYDFATRTERSIATIAGDPLSFQGGVAVSPDGKWVVYSQVSRSASDIMLVENFR